MNFITQVTISVVIYYFIRILYKKESSLFISTSFSAFSYIFVYLYSYEFISIIPTIHFMVTGLSLLFLFIAYNEIIILERQVRKVKRGELLSVGPFSVERNYKIVFKLLEINTSNLVIKAIFTFIAWLIFVITLLGIKYFNFPIKYATRSLFVAMWAVLAAYYMNSLIIGS